MRGWDSRTTTWLLLAALASMCARAHAQPSTPGPALNFVREPGAESCIGSIELAQLIETRLGRPVFVAAADAVVAIEATVRPSPGGGFVAVVAVSDGRGALYGSRELRAQRDCRELDEPLALVIAVTLRPVDGAVAGVALPPEVARALEQLFGDEQVDPEPESLPPPRSDGAEPRAASAPAAPPREPEVREAFAEGSAWWLVVEPAFFIASGLQPTAAFGPALLLRAGETELGSLCLRGALSIATSRDFRDGERLSSTTFRLYSASLAYCTPELQLAPIAASLCAGGGFGVTEVDVRNFAIGRGGSQTWGELEIGVELRALLVGPLSLRLSGAFELRPSPTNFDYIDSSGARVVVHEAEPFGARAELGLDIALF